MLIGKIVSSFFRAAVVFFLALVASQAAHLQTAQELVEWNTPVPAFRIIGNIYYVGASDVTSYLIVTPDGDILLDGGLAQTAPQIEANVKTLGFKLSSVKILLNSHAHFDHAGGLAELQKVTGAKLVAMDGDVQQLTRGGHGDFFFGDADLFPAITPNRVIHDGETVSLGGTTLTAHRTAGHTRGCTTWTMTVKEAGELYHVVFFCSASVLDGYKLVARPDHPASYLGIADDYEKSFRIWKSLPCDVFLGAHGQFFDLKAKREAQEKGAQKNPFVDPAGYQEYVSQKEADFRKELARQKDIAAGGDKTPPKN